MKHSSVPHHEKLWREAAGNRDFHEWLLNAGVDIPGLYTLFLGNKRRPSSPEEESLLESIIRNSVTNNERLLPVMKNFLSFEDLKFIQERKLYSGLIGGKSAGMLLAYSALRSYLDFFQEKMGLEIKIPESYFIGNDAFEQFLDINDLERFRMARFEKPLWEQNYLDFMGQLDSAVLPPKLVKRLRKFLRKHKLPLVVRSSSLLEDGFGTPFAGLYDSYFHPNSFSEDKNLEILLGIIRRVYSSPFKPEAFAYRERHAIKHNGEEKNLLFVEEGMPLLVQEVVGAKVTDSSGRSCYLPVWSGVLLSQNDFPSSADVDTDDGAGNIAAGLGTAVVDRALRTLYMPLSGTYIRTDEGFLSSTQRKVHAIDLSEKDFTKNVVSLPAEILLDNYENLPGLEDILSVVSSSPGGSFYSYSPQPALSQKSLINAKYSFITFHSLRGKWSERLRSMTKILEFSYSLPQLEKYITETKFRTVGEIIEKTPEEIRRSLRDDSFSSLDRAVVDSIKLFHGGNASAYKPVLDSLQKVADCRRILTVLDADNPADRYFLFRNAYSGIRNPELRQDIRRILRNSAVESEFAVMGDSLWLLQTRPQSTYDYDAPDIPLDELLASDKIFIDALTTVPDALLKGLSYIIYIDAEKYLELSSSGKHSLASRIGFLNSKLDSEPFIILAPGRLGSSDEWLGVPVRYDDINNAKLVAEYMTNSFNVDFSFGSHFNMLLVGDGILYAGVPSNSRIDTKIIHSHAEESFLDGALLLSRVPHDIYMYSLERRMVAKLADR